MIIFTMSVFSALAIRLALIKVETFDYTYFLKPWIDHLSQKGLAGLGDSFSNYNAPYLILLWVVSHLPFSTIIDVKLISIAFDFILAFGVYLVVGHFKPRGLSKYFSVVAVLFTPTVIQNSSLWGQCDVIYTSFIVFSFYAYLKGKFRIAWAIWGVAFAFKLQSMFFAPFLLFMTFYKKKAYTGPLIAAGVVVLLSALPILYGKSIADIINIYVSQTAPPDGVEMLAWFSPTAYQWISNVSFYQVRRAGIVFAGMVGLSIVSLAFLRKYKDTTVLAIATVSLLALPFFLPQIHERYLYTSEIFLVITAFVIPRFIWAAIAMQIISSMTYITYFTGGNQMPPIPFAELSLVVLVIIYVYIKYIYDNSKAVNLAAIVN